MFETGSLDSKASFDKLYHKAEILGKKLNCFIQSVESHHNELKEDVAIYQTSGIKDQKSNIKDQRSSISY